MFDVQDLGLWQCLFFILIIIPLFSRLIVGAFHMVLYGITIIAIIVPLGMALNWPHTLQEHKDYNSTQVLSDDLNLLKSRTHQLISQPGIETASLFLISADNAIRHMPLQSKSKNKIITNTGIFDKDLKNLVSLYLPQDFKYASEKLCAGENMDKIRICQVLQARAFELAESLRIMNLGEYLDGINLKFARKPELLTDHLYSYYEAIAGIFMIIVMIGAFMLS